MFRFNQHFSGPRWIIFAFMFSALFLIGCAPEALLSGASSLGTSIGTSSSTCEKAEAQLYTGNYYPDLQSDKAKALADTIYAAAPQNLPIARVAAYKFLEYETQRWSDAQYVNLTGKPNMRAIITFLTPGLIRAIVLNQLLFTYDSTAPVSLETTTNAALEKMGTKNDFAFLLLVQTESSSTPKTFSLYPAEITLHNTAGLFAKRTRSDDFLNSPLSFADGKNSGVIFYPMAVMNSQLQCSPFLDQASETSLTLITTTAKVDDVSNVGLSWKFYFPLLAGITPQLMKPDLTTNPSNEALQLASPIQEPPAAIYDHNPEAISWGNIGRFIWWKLTMDHIPPL